MRDPAGQVAGRIFAFRDISADRLVEQMKSDFVSSVSHGLRTPLTSIYGFAETLLRQDVLFGDAERQTFLGYIASESQRLTAIVDALLNVARLDTGDLQVNLAPTDVRDVVGEVVQSAQDGGGSNGHSFVLDLPAEPLPANADRSSRSCSTTRSSTRPRVAPSPWASSASATRSKSASRIRGWESPRPTRSRSSASSIAGRMSRPAAAPVERGSGSSSLEGS
jgi:signal transduction histidine kinase